MEYAYEQEGLSTSVLRGTANGAAERAKRETLADRLSRLSDHLENVTNSLDYTADRLLGRPPNDQANKSISGTTCLAATADRLAGQIERLAKINEQISEVA